MFVFLLGFVDYDLRKVIPRPHDLLVFVQCTFRFLMCIVDAVCHSGGRSRVSIDLAFC